MFKKYIPFFVLLFAGFFIYYIKTHQRGPQTITNVVTEIQPKLKDPSQQDHTIFQPVNADDLNRSAGKLIYSRHARCRMECRHIDESEVKEILATGKLNNKKVEQDDRGKTYPLEGITHDKQHVRIVFAPKGPDAVEVVTCIDLDTEWPCNCK